MDLCCFFLTCPPPPPQVCQVSAQQPVQTELLMRYHQLQSRLATLRIENEEVRIHNDSVGSCLCPAPPTPSPSPTSHPPKQRESPVSFSPEPRGGPHHHLFSPQLLSYDLCSGGAMNIFKFSQRGSRVFYEVICLFYEEERVFSSGATDTNGGDNNRGSDRRACANGCASSLSPRVSFSTV